MAIPANIEALIRSERLQTDQTGMSDARVLVGEHSVLKIQPMTEESRREADALRFLKGRLTVPELLLCEVHEGVQYLLMSRLRGTMLCDSTLMAEPGLVTKLCAQALRELWSVKDCPLHAELDWRLRIAREHVEKGDVSPETCEPDTFAPGGFADPPTLLSWLEQHRPPEDLVFVHGDLSLPNILLMPDGSIGFLDLGRAGISDRWQDIAIALRSIHHNAAGYYHTGIVWPGVHAGDLLRELGLPLDAEKERYYRLLDELY